MLTGLSIRDIVLIERLDLAFAEGLSVLTGETGAGKSILLDALGLAMGGRSDGRLLRHGSARGSVTATFQLPADHPVAGILAEHDIDFDGDLLLRRVLTSDGRTRAFINDHPVSVNLLRQLGSMLVEIQGQFAERGLMNAEIQRDILDAFGGLRGQANTVRGAFRDWRTKRAARETAETDAQRAKQDEDYLRHALEELDTLAPVADEESQLAESRSLLMNAEAILSALNAGYAEIEGETGAENRLRSALAFLDKLGDKAAQRLDAPRAALERAILETEEAMLALQNTAAELTVDDNTLESVEQRLFALRDVARKHGVAVQDLPMLQERMSQAIAALDDQSTTLRDLAAAESAARAIFVKAARSLNDARSNAAAGLDSAVNAELPPLKLEKAHFTATVTPLDEADWNENGMDRIEFQASTNPGTPPAPISKIASGGELSRFLLALRVALAGADDVPTLVFDEVDSGVGGATADAVGQRLSSLAKQVQVLVVTHSPQVAARGSAHLRVEKTDSGEAAVTGVDFLDAGGRREEVARMLSGRDVTDEARAAADRLIEGERL